ncbi:D-alanine--D-alanine ligase [Sorangium sp. So ce367]|uniref:D-alanine--D-alanine ligase n=1 Tax=Sorangium sp. So ce367 TaxID=3133305 RepID=UPI003F633172
MKTVEQMKKQRIGVLMGGVSAEREVSLSTGKGVLETLRASGYEAVGIDWTESRDLAELLRGENVTVVWNALHGTYGEDGCVQGLLECLRIPYTGSGVIASSAAMDKLVSKALFRANGVSTPEHVVVRRAEDAAIAAAKLGYPVVVKPSREGSTVGITIVQEEGELAAAFECARKCHGETFVETYIPGRELSVAILGGEVLGIVEIRLTRAFYDYAAKYESNDTEYLIPAPIGACASGRVCEQALLAYGALGCIGHARVDVRLDPEEHPWVIEVNTLPGMTGSSLLPKIARHAGIDYAALCERILLDAGRRVN